MATFTEEFTRMRQDFDQAQADRDQLFQDTREHVQNMAQGVKDQLAGFRQNMRDMHDEIAEMAGQVRTELQEMSTDLHTGGNIFRKGSSPKSVESQEEPLSSPCRERCADHTPESRRRLAVAARSRTCSHRRRGSRHLRFRKRATAVRRECRRPTSIPPDLRPAQQERKPPPHDQAQQRRKPASDCRTS